IAGLFETDWSHTYLDQTRLYQTQTPYSLASPSNAANLAHFRTYVDLQGNPADIVAGDWRALPLSQLTEQGTGRKVGLTFEDLGGPTDKSARLNSYMLVLQSNW